MIFNCCNSRLILTKLDTTVNLSILSQKVFFVFVMVCIFQVALLKQERSNLMVENEELYGKVREAQTLSRKDSVKAKQLETEVDHLKDEFDRLRALYVSTREHMDSMEVSCDIALYPVISNYLPAVKTFYIAPTVFSQTMESGGGGVNFATYCSLYSPMSS